MGLFPSCIQQNCWKSKLQRHIMISSLTRKGRGMASEPMRLPLDYSSHMQSQQKHVSRWSTHLLYQPQWLSWQFKYFGKTGWGQFENGWGSFPAYFLIKSVFESLRRHTTASWHNGKIVAMLYGSSHCVITAHITCIILYNLLQWHHVAINLKPSPLTCPANPSPDGSMLYCALLWMAVRACHEGEIRTLSRSTKNSNWFEIEVWGH